MKFCPSVLARVKSILPTGSVTAAHPVSGLELEVAGGVGAGHAEVSLPSVAGKPGLTGSPPPPTRARLVIALDAPAATATSMVIVAVPPIGMGVLPVQTTMGGVEVQVNPSGEENPTKVTNAGRTSTTRMVPMLGCEPLF